MRVEQHGWVGGRFVFEHRAGSGGMGEVYKAKDDQSGLSVAVKIMRGESNDDATRFMREARILSELEHPRIVRHIATALWRMERRGWRWSGSMARIFRRGLRGVV
jgi:eukaryotic-like serine/threonine-protein kinase